MPLLEFIDEIDATDQIRYRIRTVNGRVVDFVVQYETTIGGQVFPVVRYDASHDRGHRDILDRNGDTVEKYWLPEHMDFKECLAYGVNDIKENGTKYRDKFLEHFS